MEDDIVEHAPSTMFTIAAVQGQLTALQAKYGACLKDNTTLRKLLEEGKEDQADIYFYLQKKLDDNYNNISELELQIVEEQSDRERAEAAFEAKIKDLEAQLAHQKEKYEEKVMWLEDKLAVLKKFDERREEIEAEHQRVLKDVEVEKQKAKELVDEMERKCIRDKENVKREMLIKIQETKSNLMAMASEKLDEITKRTILENDQLRMELRFQNRETERVVAKIKKTEAENQELRNLLNLSKHTEVEMTRKLGSYSRLFKKQQQNGHSLDGHGHAGRSVVSSHAELGLPPAHRPSSLSDGASVALSSLAEGAETTSLPVIRAPGVLSDNRSEAGTSEAGMQSKDDDDEFSIVSFGSKFLPTRGNIVTRTIGSQTVPSKVDDALETLGRNFFRVRQTYPSSWTGPQQPHAKRPAVGAGRKTHADGEGSGGLSPDRSVDSRKPEPPSPSKLSTVSGVSSVGMDDLSSVGSRSTAAKPRHKNTRLGRGYSLTKSSMPHGRKIRLRRPEASSASDTQPESSHRTGGEGGGRLPVSLVVPMPELLR